MVINVETESTVRRAGLQFCALPVGLLLCVHPCIHSMPVCTEAYLISQQSLPKLQMVPFQDGGAVKLRQRITRPGNTHACMLGGEAVINHAC